ncbi:MAG: hypothetical protein GPJ54_02255 [Candidatus Heimdallarchaeota archaeon]|nr:hypothetical protein [Candidatus Heimdallarchaeota archaeon]
MSLKPNIILIFIIFQIFSFSSISIITATPGDVESPKTATIGSNTGNISSNSAGGRFYFNLSVVSGDFYNFQLTGDSDTKFDLFFFDSQYYPTIIQDESSEYVDTNSYPVKYDGYSTTNSWAFIMVFSNHIDGGIGDFTLSISELNTQTSSTTTPADSTGNTSDDTTDPNNQSDNSDTSGFDMTTGAFTMIIVTTTLIIKRKKLKY